MPRYRDEWVIDRVMFDYISGGSCACCGFSHMFLPNGTADLVDAISDLDTDAANAEKAALAAHPWPPEVRDQVWADRVKLRQRLKRDRAQYSNFCQTHHTAFVKWIRQSDTVSQLRRWLQIPRSAVLEHIQQTYNIHSAFGVVLCAVVEQVAGFSYTEYPPDGRGQVELDFETKLLKYDRRGGFVLALVSDGENGSNDSSGLLQEDMLQIWLRRMETLGARTLLERHGTSLSSQKGDDDEGDPDGGEVSTNQLASSTKPSFASDRRIVRLVIARMFAQTLQAKFLEAEEQKQQRG